MFGFFKKKRDRNSFDALVDFAAGASRIICSMHDFSMVVVGNDSCGQHIQCWFKPVRLGYRNPLCTTADMIEWAERASRKAAKIDYLRVTISGQDADGDYRSFDHQIVGEDKARQCLSSIMSLDATAREGTRIFEITQ